MEESIIDTEWFNGYENILKAAPKLIFTSPIAYSSSLTDKEWQLLEPLLSEVLQPKKQTRPPAWTKRELLDGVFYQLKNGCRWEDSPKDLPKDLPPYSTVYWHYKQWRAAGCIEETDDSTSRGNMGTG